jgi:hypothetical protein
VDPCDGGLLSARLTSFRPFWIGLMSRRAPLQMYGELFAQYLGRPLYALGPT